MYIRVYTKHSQPTTNKISVQLERFIQLVVREGRSWCFFFSLSLCIFLSAFEWNQNINKNGNSGNGNNNEKRRKRTHRIEFLVNLLFVTRWRFSIVLSFLHIFGGQKRGSLTKHAKEVRRDQMSKKNKKRWIEKAEEKNSALMMRVWKTKMNQMKRHKVSFWPKSKGAWCMVFVGWRCLLAGF